MHEHNKQHAVDYCFLIYLALLTLSVMFLTVVAICI